MYVTQEVLSKWMIPNSIYDFFSLLLLLASIQSQKNNESVGASVDENVEIFHEEIEFQIFQYDFNYIIELSRMFSANVCLRIALILTSVN